MTLLLVPLFLAAIVAANLLTASDPRWAVTNAFLLIGLDLVARDRLHDRWEGSSRWLKLGALVAAGSALSYLLNADAERIAIASAVAFAAAFTTDALVYAALRGRPWLERANWSNIPSSAVDSLVFPLLAFPVLDWHLVIGIAAAKIGGGAVWSLILKPRATADDRRAAPARARA